MIWAKVQAEGVRRNSTGVWHAWSERKTLCGGARKMKMFDRFTRTRAPGRSCRSCLSRLSNG